MTTRQEVFEEFGLTPKQGYGAIDIFTYMSVESWSLFLQIFTDKGLGDINDAKDAWELCHWANDPDNIHVFY